MPPLDRFKSNVAEIEADRLVDFERAAARWTGQ